MSGVKLTLERRKVQIAAKAKDGRVSCGVSIGDTYAAEVMTPAKAEKLAANLLAASNRVRAVAQQARRQKRGFFRRFLPW